MIGPAHESAHSPASVRSVQRSGQLFVRWSAHMSAKTVVCPMARAQVCPVSLPDESHNPLANHKHANLAEHEPTIGKTMSMPLVDQGHILGRPRACCQRMLDGPQAGHRQHIGRPWASHWRTCRHFTKPCVRHWSSIGALWADRAQATGGYWTDHRQATCNSLTDRGQGIGKLLADLWQTACKAIKCCLTGG